MLSVSVLPDLFLFNGPLFKQNNTEQFHSCVYTPGETQDGVTLHSIVVYLLVSMSLSGISIVLDLTPNYKGGDAWFTNVHAFELIVEKLKVKH